MFEIEVQRNGTAYALFKCDSGYQKVQSEISDIHGQIGTPDETVFDVLPLDKASSKIPDVLKGVYNEAMEAGCNVYVKADLPGKTNPESAKELVVVCNQLYQNLFEAGSPFIGKILYEDPETKEGFIDVP